MSFLDISIFTFILSYSVVFRLFRCRNYSNNIVQASRIIDQNKRFGLGQGIKQKRGASFSFNLGWTWDFLSHL